MDEDEDNILPTAPSSQAMNSMSLPHGNLTKAHNPKKKQLKAVMMLCRNGTTMALTTDNTTYCLCLFMARSSLSLSF